MIKGKIEVKKDNLKSLTENLRSLTKKDVLVGIPAEKAQRTPDPSDPNPISNAEIGYIMETGSPAANIPARPHMIPAIKENRQKIAELLKLAGKAALDGDAAGVFRCMNAAGMFTANAIKKKITDGVPPPLAASTIAARQRQGFSGETPLLRTGQYRNSITYVLRDSSTVKQEKTAGGRVDPTPMIKD